LLTLVGALDGRYPPVIRTWANNAYLYRQIGMRRRVLLAVTGANRIGSNCVSTNREVFGLDRLVAANADHLLGPVHAAFIYNAPLFCDDLATEPSTQSLPDQVHQN
jgi:hypothetical protein